MSITRVRASLSRYRCYDPDRPTLQAVTRSASMGAPRSKGIPRYIHVQLTVITPRERPDAPTLVHGKHRDAGRDAHQPLRLPDLDKG